MPSGASAGVWHRARSARAAAPGRSVCAGCATPARAPTPSAACPPTRPPPAGRKKHGQLNTDGEFQTDLKIDLHGVYYTKQHKIPTKRVVFLCLQNNDAAEIVVLLQVVKQDIAKATLPAAVALTCASASCCPWPDPGIPAAWSQTPPC